MNRGLYPLDPWLLPAVVWGGFDLQRRYGKDAPADVRLGESWEVSCIPGRESVIAGTTRTLADAFRDAPSHFLGAGTREGTEFPLLVKLLSTSASLSLQVHPDDDAAARLEGATGGKHEAWVVLDAAPGAILYAGIREGVTARELFEAVERGNAASVAALLIAHPARRGDVFEIAPGTVHAPGAGLVLYEIQQPSDLTYRLYDWGRLGLDGRPRELHVEKARAVLDENLRPAARNPSGTPGPGTRVTRLLDTPRFTLERWLLTGTAHVPVRNLTVVTCAGGTGSIQAAGEPAFELRRGSSCVVPRAATILALVGNDLELLVARPPSLA
jgi:mannose-6-phosphate isomerase